MGKHSALERSELTESWELEERIALAFFLEKQELEKGETLFFEKSHESKLYLIETGKLHVQLENYRVELMSGHSLGELSLSHQNSKMVTATAEEKCLFWILTQENWSNLKNSAPRIAVKLLESIQAKLAELLVQAGPPPKRSESTAAPNATSR